MKHDHSKMNHVNHSNGGGCDHGHHEHHGHNMEDSAINFLNRFWAVTLLLIPLVLTNSFVSEFFGISAFKLAGIMQFVIATVIFGFSIIFFQHAWHEIKAKAYGMMTLVSLAVGSGYLFSVASTFIPALEAEFYLEISTLIWVLLFGHYLEARSSSAAGNALKEVAKLLPKKAHLIKEGEDKEIDTDIENIKEGDVVLIKPGEKVPADGNIISGQANVNEALISGESKPVARKEGDSVVAGSICLDGSLKVRLDRVGENSTIGQIKTLILNAQKTKPRSQRMADQAAKILTFVAGITAIFTLLVWSVFLGKPLVFAFTLAITVLVIACPHALGLAIPTVTTITMALASKNGVFLKNLEKIEVVKGAQYVVFDKTGTLTKGEFGVNDIKIFGDETQENILRIAGSLESLSSHIIGQSIVQYARNEKISLAEVKDFKNIAGQGVEGIISGRKFILGNERLMKEGGVFGGEAEKVFKEMSKGGNTLVFLSDGKKIMGALSLADGIRDESRETIEKLHKLGVKTAMLTGDNEKTARGVAKELNMDEYFAEVLPEDKYKNIKDLQARGYSVIMVGDGVNDAPALTQADVGIAIGAGTDVAVEAGDIVLTRNNPLDIVRLVVLARKVYSKMRQNLFWALGYNIVAIPAAAGVFYKWGFFLRPEIGALVMSLSTVVVVINALTLKRIDLNKI